MISDNIRFSNFSDFYNKRYFIKNEYENMVFNDRLVYKYYVYSRRYLKERVCDMIWEYLNSSDIEELEMCDMALNKENMRYF